jgi:hypothetical protein
VFIPQLFLLQGLKMKVTQALEVRLPQLLVTDLTNNEAHTCKMVLCKTVTVEEQYEISIADTYTNMVGDDETGIKRFAIQEKELGTIEALGNKIVVKDGTDLLQYFTFENIEETTMGYIVFIEETNKVLGYKFYEPMVAKMNNINIQLPYSQVPYLIEFKNDNQ